MEIGKLGLKYHKKVVAIAGKCELPNLEIQKIAIAEVISLMDFQVSESESIANAYHLIQEKSSTFN